MKKKLDDVICISIFCLLIYTFAVGLVLVSVFIVVFLLSLPFSSLTLFILSSARASGRGGWKTQNWLQFSKKQNCWNFENFPVGFPHQLQANRTAGILKTFQSVFRTSYRQVTVLIC